MKYVAIIKTYADIRSTDNSMFPDTWPAECVEFDDLTSAQAAYPDKQIMSEDDYNAMSVSLQQQYLTSIAPQVPQPVVSGN